MHCVYLATDHRGESWPMLTSSPRAAFPASSTRLELYAITEDHAAALGRRKNRPLIDTSRPATHGAEGDRDLL